MAKTILGRLIIQMSQTGARETASQIRTSLSDIESRAREVGSGRSWGSNFQNQLDRLKLSPAQLAGVRASWDKLPTAIEGALNRRDAVGQWKNGVLGHFATIEREAKSHSDRLGRILGGPAAQIVLGYGAYTVGSNAAVAGAERDRAGFRMEQAGIPEEERTQILDRSEQLSAKYPGMSMTEIIELALRARSTMGDIDRTLGILEGLVQGQVVLMSAFGPDSGDGIMSRIVKAGDVLGQNEEGPQGIQNMLQIIDGLVRAGQVEGSDFDPGSILEFARRGKQAGAGWSTEFLSTTAPVLIQDQGGPQAGNALAMAFKSFVLGDNAMNGKVYRQRQAELGLRNTPNGELIGAELMTSDPFAWVEEYLRPALERAGVDVEDEGEVTRQVGRLSGSSNATAAFTRMLTQFEQIMKSKELYSNALGLDAAGDVSTRDPFVAWQGMLNSFSNFTGAIAENVEIITPGLNAISGAINSFSAAVRENPLQALGLGGLAAGAAGIGAWKVGAGITGLISAGPSLQTAATMLQQAAVALQGGKPTDGPWGDKPEGRSGPLSKIMSLIAGINPPEVFPLSPEVLALQNQPPDVSEGSDTSIPGLADMLAPEALDNMGVSRHPFGYSPADQSASLDQLNAKAGAAGAALGGLNTTLSPNVDTSSIDLAIQKVARLAAALQGVGNLGRSTGNRAETQINAMYADFGVTP